MVLIIEGTECPKIYCISVLYLLKNRFAVYLSRYSAFLRYMLANSLSCLEYGTQAGSELDYLICSWHLLKSTSALNLIIKDFLTCSQIMITMVFWEIRM